MENESLVATVDRFESGPSGEELVVLVFDDGQQLVLPRVRFPWLRRGMVLRVRLERDEVTETARREEIRRLQQELFGEAEP